MSNLTLTHARVKALRPRKSAYDIRDAKLRGFGVRVLPSGAKRYFLHIQHRGQRVWNIVGDANTMPVADARTRAASMLSAIRFGTDARGDSPPFETVADAVFRRYAQVWKPQTLYVNRSYYRWTLLPRFAEQSTADIDRQDVERWFASLRATPVSADRSMPVLSVILTEAERMGHRPEGSNPCRGIRRYRRKGRERSLSDAEIRRLAETLSAHERERPLQVAAVRLILLTGCRRSEVLTLRWSDYRAGRLFLRTRRLDRARCRSTRMHGASWNDSPGERVPSSSPPRTTAPDQGPPTDDNASVAERQIASEQVARLSGLLVSPLLPSGIIRNVLMLGFVTLGFLAFLTPYEWLFWSFFIALAFSPRIMGEVIHGTSRLASRR